MTTPIFRVPDKIAHEIKGGVGSRMVRGSSDSSRLKLERSFTFWAAGGRRLWQAADEIQEHAYAALPLQTSSLNGRDESN